MDVLDLETSNRIDTFVRTYYTVMGRGYNNKLGGVNQIKQSFETFNERNNTFVEYMTNKKFGKYLERLGYRCNGSDNFNLKQNRRWKELMFDR